jgi:hypothetical protein
MILKAPLGALSFLVVKVIQSMFAGPGIRLKTSAPYFLPLWMAKLDTSIEAKTTMITQVWT